MKISVVIPSLHSTHIAHTVKSVLDQGCAAEIIIVGLDKHNLIPQHENVRFISTHEPVCAARARNVGATAAHGDVVCFLDADCLAMPGWLERLVHCLEQGHTVVGGGVDFCDDNYWGVCDNVATLAPFLTCAPAGERAYLPSLNLALWRKDLLDAGGFDESFPGAAGEDVDLSFKLRRLGHKLYFAPQAVVLHRHNRLNARAVWQHSFRFGVVMVPLRARFSDMKKPSIRIRLAQRMPLLLLASTPLVAALETAVSLAHSPRLLRYYYAIPGLVWCKMALNAGVARSSKHFQVFRT